MAAPSVQLKAHESNWNLVMQWLPHSVIFFAFNTKLPETAVLASVDFTGAKKVISNGTRPDDHWIKNLMLIRLS